MAQALIDIYTSPEDGTLIEDGEVLPPSNGAGQVCIVGT